ncbi:DMT family transporter [Methanosarcina horonobensis]|nr:hypothetical protein [Methanosarcina horonobensis]
MGRAGDCFITIVGIFWFREPASALKTISLVVVVAGVIGLHLSDKVT